MRWYSKTTRQNRQLPEREVDGRSALCKRYESLACYVDPNSGSNQKMESPDSSGDRETSQFFDSRPLLVSLGTLDRPIRRFASDVNPDLAKASRHWTRPFIRVDTCVPGKGSFQKQRGKSAQDAFREAQFLRERHSSRLRSVFHTVVLEAFFRKIGFVQRRFLQLSPVIAMSIVRRRGRKKTLVKDAPRPSPGDAMRGEDQQEGGSNEAT